jgi:hypothetical protein
MRQLDEIDFPTGCGERIISTMQIDEDNIQDVKDLIYFVNDLSPQEVNDLINEIFNQVGM